MDLCSRADPVCLSGSHPRDSLAFWWPLSMALGRRARTGKEPPAYSAPKERQRKAGQASETKALPWLPRKKATPAG